MKRLQRAADSCSIYLSALCDRPLPDHLTGVDGKAAMPGAQHVTSHIAYLSIRSIRSRRLRSLPPSLLSFMIFRAQ